MLGREESIIGRLRSALLACMALPLGAVGAAPGCAPAAYAAPPTMEQVVRRSMTAMNTLGSVHAVSTVTVASRAYRAQPALHTSLRVTGDCAVSLTGTHVRSALRFRVVGGVTIGIHGLRTVDARYIFIASGVRGAANAQHQQLWGRWAGTGGRWQRVEPDMSKLPGYQEGLSTGCPNTSLIDSVGPTHFHSVGGSAVGGRPVWHIRGIWRRGYAGQLDLWIDRHTYQWRRVDARVTAHPPGTAQSDERFDTQYSRYGAAVRILPPRAGSATP